MKKIILILFVLLATFMILGCTENRPEASNETKNPEQAVTSVNVVTPTEENVVEIPTEAQNANESQNVTENIGLKEFTLEELAQYNGKDGKVYVAYQGKVYDISTNNAWKRGIHHGCKAGTDFTKQFSRAPHGAKVLQNYPVVGTLNNS